MIKQDQYNELEGFFGDKLPEILKFYLTTEGCILLSTDDCTILGYRADLDNPHVVVPDSDDMYLHYVAGDLAEVLQLASGSIVNVGFDHKGNTRKYNLAKLKGKIIKD